MAGIMSDEKMSAAQAAVTDIKAILAERGKTHGSWEQNAQVSMELKHLLNRYMEKTAPDRVVGTSAAEALSMICHKLARITNTPTVVDHWRDIAGYATLEANRLEQAQTEALQKEQHDRTIRSECESAQRLKSLYADRSAVTQRLARIDADLNAFTNRSSAGDTLGADNCGSARAEPARDRTIHYPNGTTAVDYGWGLREVGGPAQPQHDHEDSAQPGPTDGAYGALGDALNRYSGWDRDESSAGPGGYVDAPKSTGPGLTAIPGVGSRLSQDGGGCGPAPEDLRGRHERRGLDGR